MHNWLPINHMRSHISGLKQCPGCPCPDETIEHMYRCPHKDAAAARLELLTTAKKAGTKARIPLHILDAFLEIVQSCFDDRECQVPENNEAVRTAVLAQKNAGFDLMLRGYLVKDWNHALEASGMKHPERQVGAMLSILWDTIFKTLWDVRNDIQHRKLTKYSQAEDEQMSSKIGWYIEHRHRILARHDQFLAQHDVTKIESMSRRVKREWLHHLDIAKKAFELEQRQAGLKQRTLDRYVTRKTDHRGDGEMALGVTTTTDEGDPLD